MPTDATSTKSVDWWKKLRDGHIVGIITTQGEVLSEFTGDKMKFHEEIWNMKGSCAWRWNFDQGIWWIVNAYRPTIEELEAIQNHITRKYGLKWYDNGHHDIEHLLTKCGKKRGKDGVWR